MRLVKVNVEHVGTRARDGVEEVLQAEGYVLSGRGPGVPQVLYVGVLGGGEVEGMVVASLDFLGDVGVVRVQRLDLHFFLDDAHARRVKVFDFLLIIYGKLKASVLS